MNKIIIILLLFYCNYPAFALEQKIINVPHELALSIGIKIWFNECGGKVSGLTSWNKNENFASLGIGHFVWAPYGGRNNAEDEFPKLLKYMEHKGVAIPKWLRGNLGIYCPWKTRDEFLREQNSFKMRELRTFLQQTIAIQAQYMAEHLEAIFPKLLASVPAFERPYICQQFYALAKTPMGVYALVDYLNFKGAGVRAFGHFHKISDGTGLLQVLEGMRFAPANLAPEEAFVWSAKNALIRRVQYTSSKYHSEQWLLGWFKRVNTYLQTQ